MRAIKRAKAHRQLDMSNAKYEETWKLIHSFYNKLLLFTAIDLVLSFGLKLMIFGKISQIIVLLYIIAIYVPMCYIVWDTRKYKLSEKEFPDNKIRKSTLSINFWFYIQFIPLVSYVADFIIIYKVLTNKLLIKNLYDNSSLL